MKRLCITSLIFIVQAQGADNIPIGQACKTNADCSGTTSCCIGGMCNSASYCINGMKQVGDSCDANYECGTRCCNHNILSNQLPKGSQCDFYTKCNGRCITHQDCQLTLDHQKDKVSKGSSKSCCMFQHCFTGQVCESELTKESESKKKKPQQEAWFVIIGISFLVFLISQLINFCINNITNTGNQNQRSRSANNSFDDSYSSISDERKAKHLQKKSIRRRELEAQRTRNKKRNAHHATSMLLNGQSSHSYSSARSSYSDTDEDSSRILTKSKIRVLKSNAHKLKRNRSNGSLVELVELESLKETSSINYDKASQVIDQNSTSRLISQQRLKKKPALKKSSSVLAGISFESPIKEKASDQKESQPSWQAGHAVIEEDIDESNLLNSYHSQMHHSIEGGQNHYHMEKREGILNRHADHSEGRQSYTGSKHDRFEEQGFEFSGFPITQYQSKKDKSKHNGKGSDLRRAGSSGDRYKKLAISSQRSHGKTGRQVYFEEQNQQEEKKRINEEIEKLEENQSFLEDQKSAKQIMGDPIDMAGYSGSSDSDHEHKDLMVKTNINPKIFKKVRLDNRFKYKKEEVGNLKGTQTMNRLESCHLLEMLKKELKEQEKQKQQQNQNADNQNQELEQELDQEPQDKMPEAIHTAIDLYQIKQSLGKRGKSKLDYSYYHPDSALPKSRTMLMDRDDSDGNGNKSQRLANAGWNSTKSQASSQDVLPEKPQHKPKFNNSRSSRNSRNNRNTEARQVGKQSERKINRMTHFQVNSDMNHHHTAGKFNYRQFTSEYYLPGALELVPEVSNVPEFDVNPDKPRLHVRKPERGRSSVNIRKASGDLLEEVKQFAEKEEESPNFVRGAAPEKDQTYNQDNKPKFGQSFTNQVVDVKKLNKSIDQSQAAAIQMKMEEEPRLQNSPNFSKKEIDI